MIYWSDIYFIWSIRWSSSLLLYWYWSSRLVQVNYLDYSIVQLFWDRIPWFGRGFSSPVCLTHINCLPVSFLFFFLQKVDYPLVLDVYDFCSDDLRKRLEVPRRVQAFLLTFFSLLLSCWIILIWDINN